jgi:hypothetical protein
VGAEEQKGVLDDVYRARRAATGSSMRREPTLVLAADFSIMNGQFRFSGLLRRRHEPTVPGRAPGCRQMTISTTLLTNAADAARMSESAGIAGKDEITVFGRTVTRKTGLVHRLVGRLAVIELRKPPTAGRCVLL